MIDVGKEWISQVQHDLNDNSTQAAALAAEIDLAAQCNTKAEAIAHLSAAVEVAKELLSELRAQLGRAKASTE